jgi:hypothetical protein
MSSQEESTHIVQPFSVYLRYKGWHVEKTHGSQFQEGFPDLYIMHPQYGQRWIECKVIRDRQIHFERSQQTKFPIWIAHGVKIWIVYGIDMRGPSGVNELHNMYMSLFKEANAPYMLNPEMRQILLRG